MMIVGLLLVLLWGHAASARVIVVLGCSLSLLEGRVASAAASAGPGDVVVFAGGMGEAALAEWLFLNRFGGDPHVTRLLEDESHTTKENAEFTARLLETRGLGEERGELVVVTDWFHRARARALFRRYFPRARSLHFIGTRTWQVLPLKHIVWSVREGMALVKALVKGYLDPGVLFGEMIAAGSWLFSRLRLRLFW
jgi:uncharacterized SAM-binding protein YcdF (DUF218 family)